MIKAVGVDTLFPDMYGVVSWLRGKINNLLVWAGIEDRPAPEEAARIQLAHAVAIFDKRFDIQLDKESAVISVSFTNRDAAIAAHALDTLLKLYMEKRRAIYLEPRAELARAAMEKSRAQAAAAEHALQQFKRRHKIYSLVDERALLLARRDKDEERASLVTSEGLESRVADDNAQLEKIDSLERDFNVLQKEAVNAEDAYALYSRKYDEALAFEAMEHRRLDSVRVAQSPIVPAEPGYIRLWIMLAGTFLSIVSLFAAVAVTRFMKHSFFTVEEVEETTELKVIAAFGEAVRASQEDTQRLADGIDAVAGNANGRIITFIAARTGEGTSHVAWAAAVQCAQSTGKNVLLIEAGRISAGRSREYGYIPGNGIIDAFIENKPAYEAISAIGKGLSVCRLIRAEKHHGKVVETIQDKDFWKGLLELADTIIIDAAPLQSSSDGLLLAAKSTVSVVVIEAEKTPPEVVQNLCKMLKSAGAKVAGAVMNRRRYHIPEAVYRKL